MSESRDITLPFAFALSGPLAVRVQEAIAAIRTEGRHRVYAAVNQKGGAGKTTTILSVAAIWAEWGLRIRLIDGDPSEGSATFWLPPIYPETGPQWTLRDVYKGNCTLDDATYPTSVENLFIVPSDIALEEIERAQEPGGEYALREAIEASTRPFDATLVDTRPTLGILTVAAMTAANELFLTLGASGLDTAGLGRLANVRDKVKRRLNPELTTTGVVICAWEKTILGGDIRNALLDEYPDATHACIPKSAKPKEATLMHEPVTTWAPKNPASVAYVKFAADTLTASAGMSGASTDGK